VAVVVHGGCWRDIADLHYLARLAVALTAEGWATWSLEFRTLGEPGGGWPGTFADVARATDHLRVLARTRPLDLERVVTVGHSSGGHLALWLAGRGRVPPGSPLHDPRPLEMRGVVSLAGIADLRAFHALEARACGGAVPELLGGEPDAVPERSAAASPGELIPLGVPQLLLTGEDDPDVPPDHVAHYARRARAAGDDVRERRIAGAGHFEVVAPWSPGWWVVREELRDFFATLAR
jgi:acetyl esterase/lipase